MKKLLVIFNLLPFLAPAQNVGIGTAIPAEKPDVNGNIHITGVLKANGNAGSNGQVLMSTGGGLSWGSTGNYKEGVMFNSGSGTWTVPAGVTELMAELWGGGSGGTINCGATSGSYARTVQAVTPGYVINYTVGAFGSLGTTSSGADGNSQVTFPEKFGRPALFNFCC